MNVLITATLQITEKKLKGLLTEAEWLSIIGNSHSGELHVLILPCLADPLLREQRNLY
jgi:hypothetical protein